jgi:outer membrane lipoprotein-sorting protein
MAQRLLKWAPAVGAVVVVTVAAIAIPMTANASSTLPIKTPAQVLALVAGSHVSAFSGTIEQTSDLGLPSLPSTGPGSDSSVASTLELLTGTHTVRVYVDGPKDARVQVLDSMAERDVIRNGSNLWVYDSSANTVEHATIAAQTGTRKAHLGAMPQGAMPQTSTPQTTPPQAMTGTAKTPAQIASALLSALKSTSTVSVGTDATVAGRSAYDLILTPKVSDTLIGSVSIAVDSATGMPLGVDVDARGQTTPAFSVHFGSLTLAKPAASLFAFTPPANAKVTEVKTTKPSKPGTKHTDSKHTDTTKPTLTGKGWDAVATIAKQSELTKLEASSEFGLLTSTVDGGRLFHTTLFNVLFATDGRVLVGSVSAARLEEVAAAQ